MKKRFIALLIALALILSFCACGKEEKYTDGTVVGSTLSGEGGGRLFTPEVISLPEGSTLRSAAKVGNFIVLCAGNESENRVFCLNLDNKSLSEFSGLNPESVLSIDSSDGTVAFLVERKSDGQLIEHSFAVISSDELRYTTHKDITLPAELKGEAIFNVLHQFVSAAYIFVTADNVYIQTPKELVNFGPYTSGAEVFRIAEEEICIVSYDEAGTTIQRVTRDEPYYESIRYSEKEKYTLDGQYTRCFGSSTSDELYGWSSDDPNILYNINYQNGDKNAYANVFSSGCSPRCFIELGESKFFAATNEGLPAIWTVGKNDELQVITLATCSGDDMIVDRMLTQAVIGFNNASADYRIDLIDYAAYNSGADPYGGYTRLNADIAAGSAPDIYDLWSLSSINYATKGLLEDLKPWFDSDPDIDYSDLMPSVTAVLEKNGCLYELVPSLSVATVFTTAERFGEAKHLTMTEFLDAADKLGTVKMFGSDMTQVKFWSSLLAYSGGDYYNLERATCNFNTPEFVRVLKFAAQLPEEKDQTTSKWENVYFGDQYLLNDGQANMVMLLMSSDAVFAGDSVSIGFPATNSGGVAASADMRLGMSVSSEVKEGIWQFFKYLLGDSFQLEFASVPIVQNVLDRAIQQWCEEVKDMTGLGLLKYEGGQVTQMTVPTRQPNSSTLSRVREIIESIDCMDEYSDAMYTIVLQEFNSFAGGAITAEEAAANIQSKASIYISEQYG